MFIKDRKEKLRAMAARTASRDKMDLSARKKMGRVDTPDNIASHVKDDGLEISPGQKGKIPLMRRFTPLLLASE